MHQNRSLIFQTQTLPLSTHHKWENKNQNKNHGFCMQKQPMQDHCGEKLDEKLGPNVELKDTKTNKFICIVTQREAKLWAQSFFEKSL